MIHIFKSIEDSLQSRNYYGALSLALSLPDIGTNIEYGASTRDNKKRYTNFANSFITTIVPTKLTALDLYGLRCAYLHSGEYTIDDPEIINRVEFMEPIGVNCLIDNNTYESPTEKAKQLQIDTFCTDMIRDMTTWYTGLISSKKQIADRIPQIKKWF